MLFRASDGKLYESQTPFGFRGGWDLQCKNRTKGPRQGTRLKRLSASVAGWITLKYSTFIATLESQTPFGFGGGLDLSQSVRQWSEWGRRVSNAFRLWGRVG